VEADGAHVGRMPFQCLQDQPETGRDGRRLSCVGREGRHEGRRARWSGCQTWTQALLW
jgi:hypothetical protein